MKQLHLFSEPSVLNNHVHYQNFFLKLHRNYYQRSIYMNVLPGGEVRVSCGRTTPLKEICHFVDKNQHWINEQLKLLKSVKRSCSKRKFIKGGNFLFCGQLKILRFVYDSKKIYFCINNSNLEIHCPKKFIEEKIFFKALCEFYRDQGKKILDEKIQRFSKILELYPKKVSFRCQKSLFGSCSEEGHISLNWVLVISPHLVMDYIVIHELSHLKYLDHSNDFWNFVRRYCPHYLKSKKWLQKNISQFDFLIE